jgi:hypothetical protein
VIYCKEPREDDKFVRCLEEGKPVNEKRVDNFP